MAIRLRCAWVSRLDCSIVAAKDLIFGVSLNEVPSDPWNTLPISLARAWGQCVNTIVSGDTARRQRRDTLRLFGVRQAVDRDRTALRTELRQFTSGVGATSENLIFQGCQWALRNAFCSASQKFVERLMGSGRHAFHEAFLTSVFDRVAPKTLAKLEASLGEEPRGPQRLNVMSEPQP